MRMPLRPLAGLLERGTPAYDTAPGCAATPSGTSARSGRWSSAPSTTARRIPASRSSRPSPEHRADEALEERRSYPKERWDEQGCATDDHVLDRTRARGIGSRLGGGAATGGACA